MRFAPCQLCLHFVRRNQRYRIIDVKNRLTQHYIRSLLNHCSASPSKINSFIYPRLEDFSHVHANSRSNRAEAFRGDPRIPITYFEILGWGAVKFVANVYSIFERAASSPKNATARIRSDRTEFARINPI